MHNLVLWKVIADEQTTMKSRLLMSLLLAFGLFGTAQVAEPTQLTKKGSRE